MSDTSYIGIYKLNTTKLEEYFENDLDSGKKLKKVKRIKRAEDEWVTIEVDSIIEPEIFLKAQEKLESNKHKFNNNNRPVTNHIFAGLLKC